VRIHLIRHAVPVVDRTVPASEWVLAGDQPGLTRLARGLGRVTERGWWLSSPEPKARATASALTGRQVATDPALVEMRRGRADLTGAQFVAAVTRALAHPGEPALEGWETAASVADRVCAAAVTACVRAHAGAATDLVLVGHGTAWTVLIAGLTGTDPDIAAWRRLQLPDHCVLTGDAGGAWQLTSGWLAARS